MASYAENVSIWWRHHVVPKVCSYLIVVSSHIMPGFDTDLIRNLVICLMERRACNEYAVGLYSMLLNPEQERSVWQSRSTQNDMCRPWWLLSRSADTMALSNASQGPRYMGIENSTNSDVWDNEETYARHDEGLVNWFGYVCKRFCNKYRFTNYARQIWNHIFPSILR